MSFVDTHLHLLPGLDDGPSTVEESLALAEALIADGVVEAVATPHANYQFSYVPARVTALVEDLRPRLDGRLRVYAGCELHLSYENVQAAAENPRLYSLNGSRYLLVEFPEYFERTAMGHALQRFLDLGLAPVLAHPERNPVFQQHPEGLREYLRMGCLAQVTASSFTGRFGKRAEQLSAELLEQECIHVVATDAHAAMQRPPRMSKAHAWICQHAGPELADALCRDNPQAMLEDRALPYAPTLPANKRKSIWARLRS